MTRNFKQLLQARMEKGFFLSVGLDPELSNMPKELVELAGREGIENALFLFCAGIIDHTAEFAAAFKYNSAFFEEFGDAGQIALLQIVTHARSVAPHVPQIDDAKRGDIGKTNDHYAAAIFDWLGADAVTLHPYLGSEAMKPFLDHKDKGCIILARTSNKGADEFQDLVVNGQPFWVHVAKAVRDTWNYSGNCGVVVGATRQQDLVTARKALGDDFLILAPGIGSQGAEAGPSAHAAGLNTLYHVSSALYSKETNFAQIAGQRAKKYSDELRSVLTTTLRY